MVRAQSGRSNVYNASARAKARKASLIDQTRMRQLVQQGTDSIGASIGEMGYRAEMDLYASKMSGADAVEAALFHNLDNDLAEVLRFCQGKLKSIVAIYVERFDYEKAKTVLRAVNGGASDEMIESQILPSENPRNAIWLTIVKNTEGLDEAVEAMAGTPWGQTLAKLDAESTLEEMENALDMQYFADALRALKDKEGSPQLLKYLRMEIDHRNVINEFRSMIESQILPSENPRNATWLTIVKNTEGLDEAVEAMAGTPWGQTLAKLDAESTLEEMENALDMQYFADALRALKDKEGSPQLLKYLRMEIDHRNVINEFRSIRMGMTSEQRQAMIIPGGKIDAATMKQSCVTETDAELIDVLRRSSSFDDTGFDEARADSERLGSLDPYAELLSHQRHAVLRRFSHLSPVSAFPIIHYIEKKALEVRNLRLLVRGKAVGLPKEVLEAHMDY